LFGIKFLNHPQLRRILLTDEWVGYPLRTDYEDPINMIKL
jgi:NADH:ubiquinone oxidoreductase subunit C